MYTIIFSEDAKKDLKALSKKAPQALPKLSKLLEEIKVHPRTGTGQVECIPLQINPSDWAIWQASMEVRTFSLVKIFCRWRLTV